MKLTRIVIKNFRNHKDSDIDLSRPLVVFRGPNHSGKSTINQAFGVTLTPTTDGLDEAGRGFREKIMEGEKAADISVFASGSSGSVIERRVTLSQNSAGRTERATVVGDPQAVPSRFEQYLESQRAALLICLHTERFLQMDEAKQKALLASLVLPDRHTFDPAVVADVDRLVGAAVRWNLPPFQVIQAAYDALYKARTEANRAVRTLTVPSSLPKPEGDAPNVAEIEAEIAGLKRRRNEKATAIYQIQQRNSKRSLERVNLRNRLSNAQEEVRRQESRLNEVTAGKLSVSALKKAKALADRLPQYRELEEAERRELDLIAGAKKQRDFFVKVVDGGIAECPSCNRELTDETAAIVMEGFASRIATAEAARAEAMHKRSFGIGDAPAAAAQVERHTQAVRDEGLVRNAVEEARQAVSTADTALENMQTDESAHLLEGELAELDHRVDVATAQIRPLAAYEEREKEIARIQEQRTGLEADAERLNELVKMFDKDGLPAQLIAQHVGDFTGKLNECLKDWGYRAELSIEPYTFRAGALNGPIRGVEQLSKSEKLMFLIALQCSVAQVSGVRLVVIDQLDTFLKPDRSRANGIVMRLLQEGKLDQAILLVADDSKEAPAMPGALFYMVDGGKVERIA